LFLVHQFLSPWWRRRQVPPKRRFLQEPHGVTTQKTPFFMFSSYSERSPCNSDDVYQTILAKGKITVNFCECGEETFEVATGAVLITTFRSFYEFFGFENGSSTLLRNMSEISRNLTEPHFRRCYLSLLWDSEAHKRRSPFLPKLSVWSLLKMACFQEVRLVLNPLSWT
jgi:hypothetical protein